MQYKHDIFHNIASDQTLSDEAKNFIREVYVQYQKDMFIITRLEEGAAVVKELFEKGYLEQEMDHGFFELYHVAGLKEYFIGVSKLHYE